MAQDSSAVSVTLEEVRQSFEAMKAMSMDMAERLHAAEFRASTLETALELAISVLISTEDPGAVDRDKLQALIDFVFDQDGLSEAEGDGLLASPSVAALQGHRWQPQLIRGGRA